MKEILQKPIVRIPLFLSVIAGFAALLVAVTHALTSGRIAENRLRLQNAVILELFDEVYDINDKDEDDILNPHIVQRVAFVYADATTRIGQVIFVEDRNTHGTIQLAAAFVTSASDDVLLTGVKPVTFEQTPGFAERALSNLELIHGHASYGTGITVDDINDEDFETGSTDSLNTIMGLLAIAQLEAAGEEQTLSYDVIDAIEVMFEDFDYDVTTYNEGVDFSRHTIHSNLVAVTETLQVVTFIDVMDEDANTLGFVVVARGNNAWGHVEVAVGIKYELFTIPGHSDGIQGNFQEFAGVVGISISQTGGVNNRVIRYINEMNNLVERYADRDLNNARPPVATEESNRNWGPANIRDLNAINATDFQSGGTSGINMALELTRGSFGFVARNRQQPVRVLTPSAVPTNISIITKILRG